MPSEAPRTQNAQKLNLPINPFVLFSYKVGSTLPSYKRCTYSTTGSTLRKTLSKQEVVASPTIAESPQIQKLSRRPTKSWLRLSQRRPRSSMTVASAQQFVGPEN
jgi:hypothetical protein